MNRTYRVIFNHATGVWQCVSELACSKRKSKSFKALSVAVMMAMGGEAVAAIGYSTDQTVTQPVSFDQSIYFAPNAADNMIVNIDPNAALNMTKTGDTNGAYMIGIGHSGQAKVDANQAIIDSKDSVSVGIFETGIGEINLDNQSALYAANILHIGSEGKGTLNINNASNAAIGSNITVAKSATATGQINVNNGSKLSTYEIFMRWRPRRCFSFAKQ